MSPCSVQGAFAIDKPRSISTPHAVVISFGLDGQKSRVMYLIPASVSPNEHHPFTSLNASITSAGIILLNTCISSSIDDGKMTLDTVIGNLDDTLSSLFNAAHTIFVASTYFLGDTHTYVSLDIPITRSVFLLPSPRFSSSFANAECNDEISSFNVV